MNTAERLVSEPHFCDYDIAVGKMKGCKLADSEMGVGAYHLPVGYDGNEEVIQL